MNAEISDDATSRMYKSREIVRWQASGSGHICVSDSVSN